MLHKKILILFASVAILTSCKTKQYRQNNKQIEKISKKNNSNPVSYTALSYIDRFKDIAIREMNQYGIPASITLAQGILESGSGNSDLAQYANNHFGIKCTSDWKGKAYYKDDDQKDDCFRVYQNPDESYIDHSKFLLRPRYANLFKLDKNDYKGWASGLKNAGYATNPKYPDLLINLIEKYSLNQFDQQDNSKTKLVREDKVLKEIKENIPNEKKLYTPVSIDPKDPPKKLENDKYYTVQQGDTLYRISQMFKISVDDLKSINQLEDNTIKIGQRILVVK